jgi:hypothetical protein
VARRPGDCPYRPVWRLRRWWRRSPSVTLVADGAPCSSARDGLICSLVYLSTAGSIAVHRKLLSTAKDSHGHAETVVLAPEKRKVGSSTLPLTHQDGLCPQGSDQGLCNSWSWTAGTVCWPLLRVRYITCDVARKLHIGCRGRAHAPEHGGIAAASR